MENYISADEFTEYWKEFIQKKIVENQDFNWEELYDHDYKEWTNITIGPPVSDEQNSPFGDFLKCKNGLRYRREDGLVDLAFAPDNNFEGILSLHENPQERIDVLKKDPEKVPFYPRYYSILLEHENNIYMCYEEMAKLCYCRARLKVLITYNENVDSAGNYPYVNETVKSNFETVIKQSNEQFPENCEVEYLLLIGQKEQHKLNWFSYAFDFKGLTK